MYEIHHSRNSGDAMKDGKDWLYWLLFIAFATYIVGILGIAVFYFI
jgi:hypothetical protein